MANSDSMSFGAAQAEPDLAWCYDAVQDVSRTFALTVDALEEPMASHIALGYLLCRIPDTIEDAAHIPPESQTELLREYEQALDPVSPVTVESFREAVDPWLPPEEEWSDDWRVVAAAPTVHATVASLSAETQAAVRPPVRELVQGMATFINRYAGAGGIRIQSRDELEEYCHYAAGTVGGLITRLLTPGATAEQATTMNQTAESFGQLLQLVNVAKDVYDDYTAENNVYLPAEWLTAEGVTQESVLAAGNRDGAARVVERTAALARSYLDDAGAYLSAMPLGRGRGNTLAAWAVPYLLAVGTLREIETSPAAALTDERIAVSRDEVFAVVEAVQRGDRSDIPALRASIARGPLRSNLTE